MARAKLDRIDRRILSDLQSNGRMTNVELAERAGISAPPCLRRVRALERAGITAGRLCARRSPARLPSGEFLVLDELQLAQPKTRQVVELLAN